MSTELVSRPVPTIHFVGVSTKQSSIMYVFPEWAKELGLGDVAISGIDLPLHAAPDLYRQVVTFIRDDANSNGALVTTHKIDLFQAAHPLFDELDWFAASMHEVSSISKRGGKLIGQAKDPVSAGRTLNGMIPPGFWNGEGGDVFCMGCGGAGVAITWFLLLGEHELGRPERVIVSDVSAERLAHLEELVDMIGLETELVRSPKDNDRILEGLREGSFVINGTGLGKDRPGSPITDEGRFPSDGIVWELNYRGALDFFHQAKRAAAERALTVYDGWDYFVHGWSCVIADVFHVDIPNERVSMLAEIAARVSGRK
ncbi:MAG: shikimate dehydrogenase [Verrucomicrobia bacterium]|nr:shikimate dehydrogenase [Verrucomicrobiota bacterium]